MPGKRSKIEFCDGQNQFKVPFIMYADPTHRRLPSTPPLVGAFTANLCTEKLKIH